MDRTDKMLPRKYGTRMMRQAAIILSGIVIIGGCRGNPSSEPPIHLNPNMDYQPKYQPLEANPLFEDGAAMRAPVEGTIARDRLHEDARYSTGMDENGIPVERIPVAVTMELIKRGQERFNIYCSPCHSRVGDGKGILSEYNYVPISSLHDELIRSQPDGHYFDIITNGSAIMPSYRYQVPVADRWAIVGYIRALQRSQNAKIEDIPVEMRNRVK